MENGYIVAFVYTREAGGYEGVVTRTAFPSKEYFDKWYTPEIKVRQHVVEQGITEERAIELCARQTPRACRIAAALQEATGPDGRINNFILEMELCEAAFDNAFAE